MAQDVASRHQGRGHRLRRPALHRPAREAAARHGDGRPGGRGLRRRGLHVRRLLDRGLEVHRPVRHEAHARPGVRLRRPVLRREDAVPALLRGGARHGRELHARPPWGGPARRGLPRGLGRRRPVVLRARGGVLPLRRRALQGRHAPGVLSGRRHRRGLEHRRRVRDGQHGPPPRRQGRLLPRAPGGRGAGHPLRDAVDHEAHGHDGGQAPPRGGLVPARAGAHLLDADEAGRRAAEVQVRHPERRARLRQVGDLHAEAHHGRQRLGHARQHVDLEGGLPALRRRPLRRPLPGGAVVHRRHPAPRQGAQRVHQSQARTPTSA